MFDSEFFPTPKAVIEKMLKPYRSEYRGRYGREVMYSLRKFTILEPSAGKGDIADFIKDHLNRDEKVHCVEINTDLQSVLKGNGHTIVGDDFLTFEPTMVYDLIVMNPPFSNGDEHLLRAWELLEHGDIICLLNAETLRNPHTKRRKLLAGIVAEHGSVEDLGAAFGKAERKTGVNVSLVRLHKKREGDRFKFFESDEREGSYTLTEESLGNQIARRDVIGNLVTQYEAVKGLFAEYMRLHSKLSFYMAPLMPPYSDMKTVIEDALRNEVGVKGYNQFVNALNKNAWRSVVNQTSLKNYMTANVSRDFSSWCDEQGIMPFTEKNIQSMIELLFLNQGTILERCVVDAFELMTMYHPENKVHWEGWQTNDAYKVNRKVIMPRFCELSYQGTMLWVRNTQILDDIDRGLCLVTGQKFESIREHPEREGQVVTKTLTTSEALKRGCDRPFGSGALTDNVVESEFFKIRFFKKGTIHLYFKDEKVWERFNMAAAKGKNWLPAEDKKKSRQKKV